MEAIKPTEHYHVGEPPEGMQSIPVIAGEPDGDRILIPNIDMSKVNVTRVVLKMGYPCHLHIAGTRKQRRKGNRKPVQIKYLTEVESLDALGKLQGAKHGDVVYVSHKDITTNFIYVADVDGLSYMDAWYALQIVPTVVDGKIKNCEVRLFQEHKVQAYF